MPVRIAIVGLGKIAHDQHLPAIRNSDAFELVAVATRSGAFEGVEREVGPEAEYPNLYARFARLIAEGRSDVDRTPLRLVADAFMRCRQITTEPFED